MSSPAVEELQTPLLDLTGQSLNAMWVDEKQALFIPNEPLHWKAHKLQVLLARLDKQAERNPAQFNSTAYLNVLDKYTQACEQIKGVGDDRAKKEILDEGGVVEDRDTGAEALDSDVEPLSMDS